MEYLLKSQIFAIKGQRWLHTICPIPQQISNDTMLKTIADDEENEDYMQLSWFKKLITIRNHKRWRKFYNKARYTKRYQDYLEIIRSIKASEWKETRDIWKHIKTTQAGTFDKDSTVIKNKMTNKLYYCYCTNYGGKNSLITLHEITNI